MFIMENYIIKISFPSAEEISAVQHGIIVKQRIRSGASDLGYRLSHLLSLNAWAVT